MNLIKKLPLMAFVFGLGFMLTMSSFKSEKRFDTQTYYHVGGQYVTSPPSNTVCKEDDSYCTVTITSDDLPESFSENAIPAGAVLGTPNRSWKPL